MKFDFVITRVKLTVALTTSVGSAEGTSARVLCLRSNNMK